MSRDLKPCMKRSRRFGVLVSVSSWYSQTSRPGEQSQQQYVMRLQCQLFCRLNSTMDDTEDIESVAIESQSFVNKWKQVVFEGVFPPAFNALWSSKPFAPWLSFASQSRPGAASEQCIGCIQWLLQECWGTHGTLKLGSCDSRCPQKTCDCSKTVLWSNYAYPSPHVVTFANLL